MQMTDAEILRSYRQADGKMKRRQQVKILAELNAVSVEQMENYIGGLLAKEDLARIKQKDAERRLEEDQFIIPAGTTKIIKRKKPGPKPKIPRVDAHDALLESVEKPAAGKKKPGRPAKKVLEALIEAARHECEDIGNAIEQMEREIKELSERMNERLAAWGELKEWLKANE